MIDFYYAFFKKSYKSKVEGLIKDIERLFLLEGIKIQRADIHILDEIYGVGLPADLWIKVKDVYYTLNSEKNKISSTLKKYDIKTYTEKLLKNDYNDTFPDILKSLLYYLY